MAISRTAQVRNQILAFWKRLRSLRKSDWELEDYPVYVRLNELGSQPSASRLQVPKYMAFIVNWGALTGSGETEADALRDLATNFANVKARRIEEARRLPRPGAAVPVEFASIAEIERHRALANDFVRRVLELDWAFISDESTLWHFHDEETNNVLIAKIRALYGVDVSDIESARLSEILDRIASASG